MAERLLVAVDGSPPAETALAFAADEWPGATHLLLHVIDPIAGGYDVAAVGPTSEEWYERERERAERLLDAARESLDGPAETHVEVGRPARTIVEAAGADALDPDHVVVGSHGREGVSRVLLGSVAETVVRRSPVPVTVVR
ncbi:MAG: universal stress protein [Haloferacaceae archaeon]